MLPAVVRPQYLIQTSRNASLVFRRQKSLTSAINAGRFAELRSPQSRRSKGDGTENKRSLAKKVAPVRIRGPLRTQGKRAATDRAAISLRSKRTREASDTDPLERHQPLRERHANTEPAIRRAGRGTSEQPNDVAPEKKNRDSGKNTSIDCPSKKLPLAPNAGIPFPTADAQFLYGHSSVYAALKARRRTLYRLYIHKRAEHRAEARALAEAANVPITDVGNDWLPHMDKRSEGRPHNGLLLAASPIQILDSQYNSRAPQRELLTHTESNNWAGNWLLAQEWERSFEEILISRTPEWRHPVVLLLDDILDPQNLGSILRSAYYLGVGAVFIDKRTVAPLTPTVLKASGGAMEAIPLIRLPNVVNRFLRTLTFQGFQILAAVTPGNGRKEEGNKAVNGYDSSLVTITETRAVPAATRSPLDTKHPALSSPVLIAIGGESRGLSQGIINCAHGYIQVHPAASQNDIGLDSLNVGVAAALVCARVLDVPRTAEGKRVPIFRMKTMIQNQYEKDGSDKLVRKALPIEEPLW